MSESAKYHLRARRTAAKCEFEVSHSLRVRDPRVPSTDRASTVASQSDRYYGVGRLRMKGSAHRVVLEEWKHTYRVMYNIP